MLILRWCLTEHHRLILYQCIRARNYWIPYILISYLTKKLSTSWWDGRDWYERYENDKDYNKQKMNDAKALDFTNHNLAFHHLQMTTDRQCQSFPLWPIQQRVSPISPKLFAQSNQSNEINLKSLNYQKQANQLNAFVSIVWAVIKNWTSFSVFPWISKSSRLGLDADKSAGILPKWPNYPTYRIINSTKRARTILSTYID